MSADGSTVAYTRLKFDKGDIAEAVPTLYSAGGGQRSIGALQAGPLFFPSGWTSDGGALLGALLPPKSASQLVLWPLTGNTGPGGYRVLVSESNAGIWQGRASPDGRWVTFVLNRESRPGHAEIYVAPPDSPSPDRWIRVSAEHEWPDKPRWAPDGRTLYFLSRHPGANFNLWGIHFDPSAGTLAGDPFVITKMDAPALAIAPDMSNTEMQVAARHVVLTLQATAGNIWMVENVDR